MPVDDKKKEELLEKAYELGFEYEKKYKGCSQCTLGAVQDLFGIQDDAIFKAASGFAGGGGITIEGSCGGFTGGVMVLSQLCGRERSNFEDPDRTRMHSFDMAKRLIDAFKAEFGSIKHSRLNSALSTAGTSRQSNLAGPIIYGMTMSIRGSRKRVPTPISAPMWWVGPLEWWRRSF